MQSQTMRGTEWNGDDDGDGAGDGDDGGVEASSHAKEER